MPRVTIRVFATLRELLGTKELELEVPVGDVDELIKLIARRVGPGFKDAVIDPDSGQARKTLSILVNGRDITFLKGLETKLNDGDTISLFPRVGGG